jgi:hypothetical protein
MAAGCFIWGLMACGFAFTSSVATVGALLRSTLRAPTLRVVHSRCSSPVPVLQGPTCITPPTGHVVLGFQWCGAGTAASKRPVTHSRLLLRWGSLSHLSHNPRGPRLGSSTPCLSPHLAGTPVSLRGAPALSRGKAFGALYLTSAIGGMLGALFATNMGHTRPLGIEGWRAAFIIGGRQQVCKPSSLHRACLHGGLWPSHPASEYYLPPPGPGFPAAFEFCLGHHATPSPSPLQWDA